jgi:transcriptional regulator with XRE-family HTH domain
MTKKSFAGLYAKLEPTPGYQASALCVNFLSEIHTRMKTLGMTHDDLAHKVGVSPAHITKLFLGSTNLSIEAMVKLSIAVECTLQFHLAKATPSVD